MPDSQGPHQSGAQPGNGDALPACCTHVTLIEISARTCIHCRKARAIRVTSEKYIADAIILHRFTADSWPEFLRYALKPFDGGDATAGVHYPLPPTPAGGHSPAPSAPTVTNGSVEIESTRPRHDPSRNSGPIARIVAALRRFLRRPGAALPFQLAEFMESDRNPLLDPAPCRVKGGSAAHQSGGAAEPFPRPQPYEVLPPSCLNDSVSALPIAAALRKSAVRPAAPSAGEPSTPTTASWSATSADPPDAASADASSRMISSAAGSSADAESGTCTSPSDSDSTPAASPGPGGLDEAALQLIRAARRRHGQPGTDEVPPTREEIRAATGALARVGERGRDILLSAAAQIAQEPPAAQPDLRVVRAASSANGATQADEYRRQPTQLRRARTGPTKYRDTPGQQMLWRGYAEMGLKTPEQILEHPDVRAAIVLCESWKVYNPEDLVLQFGPDAPARADTWLKRNRRRINFRDPAAAFAAYVRRSPEYETAGYGADAERLE